jgi:DNA-binding IclR family transcriptional regulator
MGTVSTAGPRTTRLTSAQREVLEVLNRVRHPVTLVVLAGELGRPREGVARAAASLVRRGLAERHRQQRVAYSITAAGREVMAPC